MSMQDRIDYMMTEQRAKSMKTAKQLMVCEILLKLQAVKDKTKPVVFDFGGIPRTLNSWRGSYEELALGFDDKEGKTTVQDLIDEFAAIIGATLQGYKGGEYLMGKTTPVWADNYGISTITAILEIEEQKQQVVIQTGKEDYFGDE